MGSPISISLYQGIPTDKSVPLYTLLVENIDTDEVGHQICLGIRHGLFGASAHQEDSITTHCPKCCPEE